MSKNIIVVGFCLMALSVFSVLYYQNSICYSLDTTETEVPPDKEPLDIESWITKAEAKALLSGTVHIYPKEFQEHDLLYVRIVLQNKTDEPVMTHGPFHRDFACWMYLVGEFMEDQYAFPYDGYMNYGLGTQTKIEPNASFVAFRDFFEFPEYITLHSSRTVQEDFLESNEKFIAHRIGTGKKCKLVVRLGLTSIYETSSYISEFFEVKSRSETEMAAIEAWHAKFGNFLAYTSRNIENYFFKGKNSGDSIGFSKVPAIKDYEDFEKQLSPGTLKNYIHFRKLLASIPDESTPDETDVVPPSLVPDEHFKKLGDYFDTLHPIEQGALIEKLKYYFGQHGAAANHREKMMYFILPRIPKSEREGLIDLIQREEYHKTLLELPEPE